MKKINKLKHLFLSSWKNNKKLQGKNDLYFFLIGNMFSHGTPTIPKQLFIC